MKNLKKIMCLSFAFFALVLSSCSSSDDTDLSGKASSVATTARPGTQEEFIKFKYNGAAYSFVAPTVLNSMSLNTFATSSSDNIYKKISLWMPKNVTKGTYPIVNSTNLTTTYQAIFTFMTQINNANATSGTMVITTADSKKVEGTFTFSGTSGGRKFTVTDGSFSILRQ
nr:hypothetical protein [uncultured Flavobacterium sp.]